jgi:hypothetical protein
MSDQIKHNHLLCNPFFGGIILISKCLYSIHNVFLFFDYFDIFNICLRNFHMLFDHIAHQNVFKPIVNDIEFVF